MKLIEIREGLSIASDKIESVEYIDSFSCRVYTTAGNSYDSILPYPAMLELLGQNSNKQENTMDKLDKYLNVATVTTL